MKFIEEDGYWVALRDDGCNQNYLGIRVCESARDTEVMFDAFRLRGQADDTFDRARLYRAVSKAVATFNVQDARQVIIESIRYVPGDPQRDDIYESMAAELLKHFVGETAPP